MLGAVDDEVRDIFGGDKNQRDSRKHNLEIFGSSLMRCYRLDSPLRRRSRSQATNPPNDVQIDYGTSDRQNHHRNPYCVSMEPAGGAVQARRRSQSAKTNHESHAADRHYRGASALQQDEYKA